MDTKEAIAKAKMELASLFADDKIADIEFEEIERARDKWFVTLSFVRPSREEPQGKLAEYIPADWRRERRVVTVKNSGEILGVTSHRPFTAQ